MSDKLVGLVVTNLAGSGAEKVVLNLFDMFEKKGLQVYIFILEDVINYDLTPSQKNRVISLTKNRKYHKLFSSVGDKLLGYKLWNFIKDIENKENKKFDLLISNLPSSDRVCSFLDNKRNIYYCIHTSYLQEILEFKKNKKEKRALKKEKLYKSLYKDKKLISVSNGIIEDTNKLGVEYKSISTIYNPFNFDDLRSQGSERPLLKLDYDYIICASAFRSVKRHDILLEAYKKSGLDIKLVLMCKPFDGLNKLIEKLDLKDKVTILGFQKNPYPYIKNAKFLVLSSEREGLPTVLVESLILGTPIVSTNCISGPSEILTDNLSKYLSKVNDSSDLAKKMNNAYVDNVLVKSEIIEKFSEDNIISKYLDLIKE